MRTPADTTDLTARDPDRRAEGGVGSPEHLRSTFAEAAAATDRAVGLWLSRKSGSVDLDPASLADAGQPDGDVRILRALVRASATAYVRRLRADGATPERMLVLVKVAAGHPGASGFGARELTNDIVRWSIEAYFND